jgi:hypothetical protein
VLDEEMVDEELLLARAELPVDPEFVRGDEPEAVVLAEIGEFLVDRLPDIAAVHDPYGDRTDLVVLLEIWLLHGSPALCI